MKFEKPLESCTLLYVEDEKEVRSRIVSFLASRVKTVWYARNGEEGLRLYEANKPDIIVTDLKMPKMDGIRMAKLIRAENADIPILLTAAYGDEHRLFHAIEAKITGFIRKPLRVNELLHALEDVAKKITYDRARMRVQATMAQHYLAIEEEALLIYIDSKGDIKKINEPMSLLLNYPSDLLEGEPFEALLYKDHNFPKYRSLFEAIDNGNSWHGEIHLQTQLDMELTFKATLVPIFDTDRPQYQFMMLLEDITELVNYRKILKNELDETQNTLQEKIHFLEQYQNAINEGTAICRFTEEGTILRSDRRFDTIFGFEENRKVKRSFYELCPNAETVLRRQLLNAVRKRVTLRKRIRCVGKENSFHVTDSIFIPIYRINGEIEEIISIHNDITDIIKLNEEIRTTQKELLYILGEVAESRSRETGNHVKRVAEYSRLLATLAGLEDDDVELLYIVAPMHDVGKIAIPDSILLKAGPLTAEETEVMKRHTLIGGELFGRSERPFMKAARIVALEHHENYDGSGYPFGKKGEEIHVFGRIVAITDVFDALSVDRVYKKGWPVEDVIDFMRRQRGRKFDPLLIDLFLENIDLFLEIRNNLKPADQ
ncbi:HD domain-containing phosphohydrolase [Hydrogenimonas sp. SS33]|uniref:response regulator n=1 Tax=Hydrogenimonas leucolamina TaxID=2954236 RepID=UPI00336BCA35